MAEKLDNYKASGCSISYHTVLKKYTLNIPFSIKSERTANKNIASIDPGIRCFANIYTPNKVIEIGNNCTTKLLKVCQEIDIIKSRMNRKEYYVKKNNNKQVFKMTAMRKKNLRKALHRKIEYLKNLKSELHNKTINYLCSTYKTIILPPFKTQEMAGKLRSKEARSMYNLSFYSFRMKLLSKAQEKNVRVIIKPEYYTSKTCGKCGNIKSNLEGDKIYKCEKCGLTIDRDINGARNILLRNLMYC